MSTQADVDVLVVGAGPAGLNGALVLARSRRTVLVVDAGAPRNAPAPHMHGYLGLEGASPADLIERGRAEVTGYGAEVRSGTVCTLTLDDGGGHVRATLADGDVLTARRALVTTGLTDVLPTVPGLTDRWGLDVLHCPYCHGWEARDQAVAVLATTAAEADKALVMHQWSDDVVLVLHGPGPSDLTERTRAALEALGVRLDTGPVERLQVEGGRLTGVRMRDGRSLPCDILVVQPTVRARDDLLTALGAQVRSGPYGELVVTETDGFTGLPGVWAAGNVTDPAAQVVTSAADGYRAALSIDASLMTEDVDAAIAASSRT
ncbi:NAD(P)/FAD-dependent oxidoreductase [Cellulomonas bogoriensis]|uniref:Thioredoxin reductase n=1 Tax=Cellulomonas bogoriensis 69B4 = DSM 16987 TaxID=1386082 RepID=A0A0A0C132_9CELL|nr:NAD(P)/FAD-dependent oxidoreductase [Cellulomonas bogoriensis]KGM14338.1 thioredoxin reductase [Cellulomonas bogoriensis 69B4 = DSM 16987]